MNPSQTVRGLSRETSFEGERGFYPSLAFSIVSSTSISYLEGDLLTLNSATGKDPRVQPRIDPQYLQSRVDVEVLSVGLRVADQMSRTKPLADKIRSRAFPSPKMDINDPGQREEVSSCAHHDRIPPVWYGGFGTGGR